MTNDILLTKWQTELAQKIFIESDSEQYTYREAADYVSDAAHSINRLLGADQEIVPMLLPNSPQFVLILLAIMAAGKIPYPIQPTSKPGEFQAKICDLPIRSAICDELSYSLITDAALKPIRVEALQPVLAAGENASYSRISGQSKLICVTSGTTARPKRIVLQLGRVLDNAKAHAESLGLSADDRILSCLPFHHVFTLASHIFSVISLGATFVVGRDPLPQTISYMIANHRVSYTSFVPAILDAIVRNFERKMFNLSSLKKISVGSAPVSAKQIKQYRNFFIDQEIYVTYGLSEAGPRVSTLNVNQTDESLWDTVGLPIGNTQVRIAHPNQNGIGELQVQAPWQMLEYYNEADAQVWDKDWNSNEKWLNTGDLATLTPEGYIRLQGRKKNLIISGGVNISPAEIEAALTDIPWVVEAAVIAVPDRKRGEVPYAFVHCSNYGTATEILTILRDRLDLIKVPKRIHFVNYVPRNATGKVDRFALLEIYRSRRVELMEESA